MAHVFFNCSYASVQVYDLAAILKHVAAVHPAGYSCWTYGALDEKLTYGSLQEVVDNLDNLDFEIIDELMFEGRDMRYGLMLWASEVDAEDQCPRASCVALFMHDNTMPQSIDTFAEQVQAVLAVWKGGLDALGYRYEIDGTTCPEYLRNRGIIG
ncbi:MAG: hypothetical protein ACAI44_13685 [Candidatus Sericytochromatia bacterium]